MRAGGVGTALPVSRRFGLTRRGRGPRKISLPMTFFEGRGFQWREPCGVRTARGKVHFSGTIAVTCYISGVSITLQTNDNDAYEKAIRDCLCDGKCSLDWIGDRLPAFLVQLRSAGAHAHQCRYQCRAQWFVQHDERNAKRLRDQDKYPGSGIEFLIGERGPINHSGSAPQGEPRPARAAARRL